MDKKSKRLDLDRVISVCQEYQDIFSNLDHSYYPSPDGIIEACNKLKVLGLNWGDRLPRGDFRMRKGYHITNSETNYKPDKETYYIEWDNGNIGRLQFVSEMYWYLVSDEWDSFLNEMKSYNPVDYDPLNCHIVYDIENGKRVMADYKGICDRAKEKMMKKVRLAEIEKKKAELEKLISEE